MCITSIKHWKIKSFKNTCIWNVFTFQCFKNKDISQNITYCSIFIINNIFMNFKNICYIIMCQIILCHSCMYNLSGLKLQRIIYLLCKVLPGPKDAFPVRSFSTLSLRVPGFSVGLINRVEEWENKEKLFFILSLFILSLSFLYSKSLP